MTTHHCDVLVIGSGGAALRAALAATEENLHARVLIGTKGQMGRSGVTATACSDRMAFQATLPHTEPAGPENWRYHAEDIFRLGGFVSDRDLADLLAQHSADAFDYLDRLGVPFVRDSNGQPHQFLTDGSRYARACYTGPYTANHIEAALVGRTRESGIQIVEHCTVAELLIHGGRVIGGLGLVGEDWVGFCAQAVVLASGGGGEAFRASVFPPEATGDGYAMAYRTGAELVNMEFVQIGLCSTQAKLALSGSILRCVPRVMDGQGREFLYDYFPRHTTSATIHNIVFRKGSTWPVCSEEVTSAIDVAVFKELRKGKRAFLDFRENPQGFAFEALDKESQERYEQEIEVNLGVEQRRRSPLCRLEEINPEVIRWLGQRGTDLRGGDRIGIAPAVQHFQGGVKIRSDARSTIPGLYAAGECAGGQHGANRPGGNSLLDCQVFGKIAGTQAARAASKWTTPSGRSVQLARRSAAELERQLERGISATQARHEIQEALSDQASVVRTECGLEAGLDRIVRLKAEGIRADERGRSYAVETRNMLCVAEMIMGAAKLRRESRGPHLFFERSDDPRPLARDEDEWRRYIVVSRGPHGTQFEARKPAGVQGK